MEEIKRQVKRAQWRLNLQQILAWMPWTLFVTLLVAAIGVAIPKIWVVQADSQVWFFSWLGGSIATGIAAGLLLAYMHRRGALEAAIELDRRFGLKERVSSSLALSPSEKESEIGQALLTDAVRRVERCEVAEQFPVQLRRPALLPLVPVAAMIAVFFLLNNAEPEKANASPTNSQAAQKKQIQNAKDRLAAKVAQTKKEAEEKGLKLSDELNAFEKKMEEMQKRAPEDRKDALIKLNDLAKEIEKQRNNLPSKKDMKDQFQKMQELTKGPADKLAEALKDGDMSKAKNEIEKIKEELAKGNLSPEDKKKLGEQLEKMKEKIEEAKQAREQKKQELKEKIEQKKKEGDPAGAAEAQQELEEMEAKEKEMAEGLEKMAQKFGDLAKAMQDPNGDPKEAAAQLDELAEEMDALQKAMEEGEQLDKIMEGLAEAKEGMKCEKCEGQGCKECEGKGKMPGEKEGRGDGLGKGQGQGNRPEEENETKKYDSQNRVDPKKGESIRIGEAGGPNIAGKTRESVKAEIQAESTKAPDAVDETGLSREQKEHAKQYFQQFRDGK